MDVTILVRHPPSPSPILQTINRMPPVPPASPALPDEQSLWSGSPSQVINLGTYFICLCALIVFGVLLVMIPRAEVRYALAFGMLVTLVVALCKFVATRCRRYEVTSQRIRTSNGVFSRRTDEFELYRVKDITLYEPFFLRMSRAGNIVITTNDATTPTVTLEAIHQPQNLREQIRKHAEICRDRKGVRVTEME